MICNIFKPGFVIIKLTDRYWISNRAFSRYFRQLIKSTLSERLTKLFITACRSFKLYLLVTIFLTSILPLKIEFIIKISKAEFLNDIHVS